MSATYSSAVKRDFQAIWMATKASNAQVISEVIYKQK